MTPEAKKRRNEKKKLKQKQKKAAQRAAEAKESSLEAASNELDAHHEVSVEEPSELAKDKVPEPTNNTSEAETSIDSQAQETQVENATVVQQDDLIEKNNVQEIPPKSLEPAEDVNNDEHLIVTETTEEIIKSDDNTPTATELSEAEPKLSIEEIHEDIAIDQMIEENEITPIQNNASSEKNDIDFMQQENNNLFPDTKETDGLFPDTDDSDFLKEEPVTISPEPNIESGSQTSPEPNTSTFVSEPTAEKDEAKDTLANDIIEDDLFGNNEEDDVLPWEPNLHSPLNIEEEEKEEEEGEISVVHREPSELHSLKPEDTPQELIKGAKKFSFLEEDDDLLDDDDDFLDDDMDENKDSNSDSLLSSDEEDERPLEMPLSNRMLNGKETAETSHLMTSVNSSSSTSKYAPASVPQPVAHPDPNKKKHTAVAPFENRNPTAGVVPLQPINSGIAPVRADIVEKQKVVHQLDQEKKKSDAYDFPIDLVSSEIKKVHAKPVPVTTRFGNRSQASAASIPKNRGSPSSPASSLPPYAPQQGIKPPGSQPRSPYGLTSTGPPLAQSKHPLQTYQSSVPTSMIPPTIVPNTQATNLINNAMHNPPQAAINMSRNASYVPKATADSQDLPAVTSYAPTSLNNVPIQPGLPDTAKIPVAQSLFKDQQPNFSTVPNLNISANLSPQDTVSPKLIIPNQKPTQTHARTGSNAYTPYNTKSASKYAPTSFAQQQPQQPQNDQQGLFQYPSTVPAIAPLPSSQLVSKSNQHTSMPSNPRPVENPEQLLHRQFPSFNWTASNKVVYCIPSTVSQNSYMMTGSSGETIVNIVNFESIMPANSALKTFPGPLTKNKTKKKDIEKWLDSSMSELDSTSMQFLLLAVLKHKLQDNPKLADVADILHDPANVVGFLSAPAAKLSQPSPSRHLSEEGLTRLLALLQAGQQDNALQLAMEQEDYSMALLVASLSGKNTWSTVIEELFAKATANNNTPIHSSFLLSLIFHVFIGNSKAAIEVLVENEEKRSWSITNWRTIVAAVLKNVNFSGDTTPLSHFAIPPMVIEFLLEFGCFLVRQGRKLEASIVFMIADVPLTEQPVLASSNVQFAHIGSDNVIECILWSEVYEYIHLSQPKPKEFRTLLPLKLLHAYHLHGLGLTQLASKYVDHLTTLLKSAPKNSTVIVNIGRGLAELSGAISGTNSGWLGKPKLSSVWGQLDKSFNKFIGGDDDILVNKPAEKKVFDGYTPVSSRNSSMLDLTRAQSNPYPYPSQKSAHSYIGDSTATNSVAHSRATDAFNGSYPLPFGISSSGTVAPPRLAPSVSNSPYKPKAGKSETHSRPSISNHFSEQQIHDRRIPVEEIYEGTAATAFTHAPRRSVQKGNAGNRSLSRSSTTSIESSSNTQPYSVSTPSLPINHSPRASLSLPTKSKEEEISATPSSAQPNIATEEKPAASTAVNDEGIQGERNANAHTEQKGPNIENDLQENPINSAVSKSTEEPADNTLNTSQLEDSTLRAAEKPNELLPAANQNASMPGYQSQPDVHSNSEIQSLPQTSNDPNHIEEHSRNTGAEERKPTTLTNPSPRYAPIPAPFSPMASSAMMSPNQLPIQNLSQNHLQTPNEPTPLKGPNSVVNSRILSRFDSIKEAEPVTADTFEPVIRLSSSVRNTAFSPIQTPSSETMYDDMVEEESEDESDSDENTRNSKAQKEERKDVNHSSRKSQEDNENDENNGDSNRNAQDHGKGWFGWLKKDTNEKKPIKAKLGHKKTNFYYDENLKRWVNKNASEEEKEKLASPPPPPPIVKRKDAGPKTKPRSGSTSNGNNMIPPMLPAAAEPTNKLAELDREPPSMMGRPPVAALGIDLAGKKANGLDDILSISGSQTSRRKKKSGRGYVNVMSNNVQ